MAVIEIEQGKATSTPERSVRILLNGTFFASTQASPYDLADLAVGWLLSEEALSDDSQIESIDVDDETCTVCVRTTDTTKPLKTTPQRGARGSSGALMGPSVLSIPTDSESDLRFTEIEAERRENCFTADDLLAWMDDLCEKAPLRNAGQSVHACGLGIPGSRHLVMLREDIGRHNAVDKLVGSAWRANISLKNAALLITGRISAEMAMKAYHAGCPLLCSRKSATDDAIERADRLGLTLVAHCRDGRMRVLTHPQRMAQEHNKKSNPQEF